MGQLLVCEAPRDTVDVVHCLSVAIVYIVNYSPPDTEMQPVTMVEPSTFLKKLSRRAAE